MTGVRLRALSGETFTFDPGAMCLEFGLTGGEGYRAAYETLHAPADLSRWMQARFGVAVEVADPDLVAAKRLREAVWQCADARADGLPIPSGAVDEINRWAASPPLAPQISAGGLAWAKPVVPGQVLSSVAADAVELFSGPIANRIRRCAGTNCPLIFADTSRPGRRRWCSMERCGNRAKVQAFRDRQEQEET